MVVFDGLSDLQEGQGYQLWVGHGGEMESEETFVPTDADRSSYHKLLSPGASPSTTTWGSRRSRKAAPRSRRLPRTSTGWYRPNSSATTRRGR